MNEHMPDHDAHSGHDQHEGHTPDVPGQVLALSRLDHSGGVLVGPHRGAARLSGAGVPWLDLDPCRHRDSGLPLRWPVFLKGAFRELRARLPGMMTLISLAISVAFVFSWVVELGLIDAEALWWELSTLVTIMLLGHWIEMRSISQAQGALKELAKLLRIPRLVSPTRARRRVPVGDLREGDIVLIRPGESVPVDGIVQKGASAVNEAMLTGESRPVEKNEGDEVIAATINGEGSLRVRVTGTGTRPSSPASCGSCPTRSDRSPGRSTWPTGPPSS